MPHHIANLNSPHAGKPGIRRSLSIATAIMMGSVLLSRIMGLVREQVLAGFEGTSFEMDAYVTAFLIPELLNHFLAGGFLTVTFIPIFQKYLVSNEHDRAWRSFSNLITIGSVLFAILIPMSIIFTPDILSLLGSHISDPRRLALTVRLTRIILPAQILFYWGAFLSAVQMANHRFFLPALAPLCYNLGIIAGGVFLGSKIGIEGFAWGVLIGAFVGNVLIQVPGAYAVGMKLRPRFDVRDPDLSSYILLTLPMILGIGMTFSNEVFFRFFGSFLDEGATSSVNYALRTMMMVVAVFGQASGVASYPFLSRMAAEKQFGKMTLMLNSVLTRIAIYLVPLSAIMIVLSPEIIAVLFERGNFTRASTMQTAPVLAIYLVGAYAFSASMIAVRMFYAMQKTVFPMVISSCVSLMTIPLYIVLSSRMEANGMALAAVIGMTVQFLVLYTVWHAGRRTSEAMREPAKKFMKILVISVAGALIAFYLRKAALKIDLGLGNTFQSLLIIALVSVPSLAVIFAAFEFAGVQQLRETIGGLLARKRAT